MWEWKVAKVSVQFSMRMRKERSMKPIEGINALLIAWVMWCQQNSMIIMSRCKLDMCKVTFLIKWVESVLESFSISQKITPWPFLISDQFRCSPKEKKFLNFYKDFILLFEKKKTLSNVQKRKRNDTKYSFLSYKCSKTRQHQ